MRVIGVDPGVAATGYAVVETGGRGPRRVASGVVRTPRGASQARRLAELRAALVEIVRVRRPEVMAIERVFFNVNVRTAMAVGQAAGVALATAGELGLEVADYTPTQVKTSVAGVGNASKRQVQAMVAALLDLRRAPPSPDAADACALAICHLNRAGLARALATREPGP